MSHLKTASFITFYARREAADAERRRAECEQLVRRVQSELETANEARRDLNAQVADRSADAELQLKECYRAHETRAAQLEQRLAELSNAVGLNEKLRCALID